MQKMINKRVSRWPIAFLLTALILALFIAIEARAQTLPTQKISFFYKDRPFQETMIVLCKHVEIKCQFSKGADTDMTYIIEVESLRWDTVFLSALNAYKFQYRWIDGKTIEIYK